MGNQHGAAMNFFTFMRLAIGSFVLSCLANTVAMGLSFALWRRIGILRTRGLDPAPDIVFN